MSAARDRNTSSAHAISPCESYNSRPIIYADGIYNIWLMCLIYLIAKHPRHLACPVLPLTSDSTPWQTYKPTSAPNIHHPSSVHQSSRSTNPAAYPRHTPSMYPPSPSSNREVSSLDDPLADRQSQSQQCNPRILEVFPLTPPSSKPAWQGALCAHLRLTNCRCAYSIHADYRNLLPKIYGMHCHPCGDLVIVLGRPTCVRRLCTRTNGNHSFVFVTLMWVFRV